MAYGITKPNDPVALAALIFFRCSEGPNDETFLAMIDAVRAQNINEIKRLTISTSSDVNEAEWDTMMAQGL